MEIKKTLFLISILLNGISFAAKEKLVNAGILPYWYDEKGKAYFLIGQEPNDLWADFGGNFEKKDADNKTTAAREFSEETRHVYGKYKEGINPLEKQVYKAKEKKQFYLQKSIEYIKPRITQELMHPKKYYKMYLAKVDFIPADTFNNAAEVPHFEKKEYAWVPVDQFMAEMKQAKNRWNAFYLTKQIRRQIYDVFIHNYELIMETIYPEKKKTVKKSKSDCSQPSQPAHNRA